MTVTGNFTFSVTGLIPSTTYHFRASADGGIHGVTTGADMTFTTLTVTAPAVTTLAASSVSYNSTTMNGSLDSLGTAGTVSVFFEYGPTTGYGSATTIQAVTTACTFYFNVSGLTPGTTYHFRAKADGGIHGITVGSDMTFTTLAVTAPSVTTLAASNVGYDKVTLNGNLNLLGTASTVNISIDYGPTTSYGSTTTIQSQAATGIFSFNISGLTHGNTYHFRARADGGIHGVTTGSDMTFTTLSAPQVATSVATNVSYTSVTLNGVLTSLGVASTVNVFFKYDTSTVYGNTTVVQVKSAPGPFSININGLQTGTTYYFIAYAVDAANNTESGIGYGTDLTFATLPVSPPEVSTSPGTAITNTGVTLNGFLDRRGTASTVNVSFDYATETYYLANNNSYDQTSIIQIVPTAGAFSVVLTGLSPNTVYHFRARANGGPHGDAVPGADMTFMTATSAPVVATNPQSNLAGTSVTLNGNLTTLGAPTVSAAFEYATDSYYLSNGNTYNNISSSQVISAAGTFGANLTGLTPNTIYHFRAKAIGAGTAYGADLTFTTLSGPEVSTNAATNVSYFSATISGNLTSLGIAANVNAFFKYDTTIIYGKTTPVQVKNTTGAFSFDLTGLQPSTTYHFIAYAVDTANNTESGIGYGTDLTFTTLVTSPPEVSTSPATFITSANATLNGFLDSRGTADSVNVSFEYGLTTGYGSSTPSMAEPSAGAFSANVTSLTPNTTYHFRTKADGGLHGAAIPGADMIFTTPPIPPVVNTVAASSVSYDRVALNGSLDSLGSAGTVNVYFEYGTTTNYGNSTTAQPLTNAGTFRCYVSGLVPGATYHFRGIADGGIDDITSGSDMTFTTLSVTAPGIGTSIPSGISYDRVTLNSSLDSLGTAGTVNVSFEYGPTTSYGNSSSVQALTATGAFNFSLTDLSPSTTYHFRARADGGIHGFTTGPDMTFTTLAVTAPSVTTNAASNVSYDHVTLNGSLGSLGTAGTVNVSFEYGTTTNYGSTTTIQAMTTAGSFNFIVLGLAPANTYHFRARADGGIHGLAYGADMTFTTPSVTMTSVTTVGASGISYDRAILNGSLDSLGSADTVNVSFEYGTTTGYGSLTAFQVLTATGAFNVNVSGLSPSTTYYFRARADGGIHGITTGLNMTFTTLPVTAPGVTTAQASGVNYNRGTLNGSLDSLGTARQVNVSFEYGPTTSYGSVTTVQVLAATGTFSFNISGLTPGTTYHCRAIADGGIHGLTTGSDITFTTLTSPAISTGTATSITFNSVTLNGNLTSLGTASSVSVFFEYGTEYELWECHHHSDVQRFRCRHF